MNECECEGQLSTLRCSKKSGRIFTPTIEIIHNKERRGLFGILWISYTSTEEVCSISFSSLGVSVSVDSLSSSNWKDRSKLSLSGAPRFPITIFEAKTALGIESMCRVAFPFSSTDSRDTCRRLRTRRHVRRASSLSRI